MSNPYSSEAICETIDALEREIERLRCRGMLLGSQVDILTAERDQLRVSLQGVVAQRDRLIGELNAQGNEITRLRGDKDALLATIKSFADEAHWKDAVGCLQWVGKRHAMEYAQSTLSAVGSTTSPAERRCQHCDSKIDEQGKWIDDHQYYGEHPDECLACGARMWLKW